MEDDVNDVRLLLSQAQAEANNIDKRYEVHSSFKQKENEATKLIDSFSSSVSELQSNQTGISEQLNNISNDANSALTETIPQISKDLISAQLPGYTISQQASVAEEVKNRTEEGLYSSLDLLMLIKETLLPSIQKSTDTILNNKDIVDEILVNTSTHFEMLESQVNQISNVSSLAVNLATASFNTANAVLIQYNINAMNFSEIYAIANGLSSNVSSLTKVIKVLYIKIQEMQVTVDMIHSQFPFLPSSMTISSLQSEYAMIDQMVNGTTNEIESLLIETVLLNSTLEELMKQYQNLLSQLDPIIIEIDSYSMALNQTYEDAFEASNVAINLMQLTEIVLNVLQNFSDNIKELQEKAEDAMMSVSMIQSSLNQAEEKVNNAMSDLNYASEVRHQVLPLATQLETGSQTLYEVNA